MKRILFLLLPLLLALNGCGTIEIPDNNDVKGPKHKVVIHTRAAENVVTDYPVEILAYDSGGKCRARQTIKSGAQPISLNLPSGEYQVVAYSGLGNDWAKGMMPEWKAALFAEGSTVVFDHPLLRGEAAVTVAEKRAQVHLLLAPVVTATEIRLHGLPDDAKSASVLLEPAANSMNIAGERGNVGKVELPLSLITDGVWACGVRYLLPGGGNATRMSIRVQRGDVEHVYAYTYPATLTAGTPYRFEGTYVDDAQGGMIGDLSVAAWQSPVVQAFRFGRDVTTPSTPPVTPPGGTTPSVGGAKAWEGRIFENHIVALVQNVVNNEADFVLISREQWDPVPSAFSETAPSEARQHAAEYAEGGLNEWHIPSRAEAAALAAAWHGERLEALNVVLRKAGIDEIYDKSDGRSVPYLCDEAQALFSFVENSRVRKAAKSGNNYLLRLVKTVHVRFQ